MHFLFLYILLHIIFYINHFGLGFSLFHEDLSQFELFCP